MHANSGKMDLDQLGIVVLGQLQDPSTVQYLNKIRKINLKDSFYRDYSPRSNCLDKLIQNWNGIF